MPPPESSKRFLRLLKELEEEHQRELKLFSSAEDTRASSVQSNDLDGMQRGGSTVSSAQDASAVLSPDSQDESMGWKRASMPKPEANHRRLQSMQSAKTADPRATVRIPFANQLEELAMLNGWTRPMAMQKSFKASDEGRSTTLNGFHDLAQKKSFILHRLVHSWWFDVIAGLMIVANSIFLGVMVNKEAEDSGADSAPVGLFMLDLTFASWFLTELTMRLGGNGFAFFFNDEWSWNCFDTVVVLSDVAEKIVILLYGDGMEMGNFTVLRVLRVLRVIRVMRLVKILSFFREFRLMVSAILRSGASVFWVFLLFIVNMYLFAMFLVQQTTAHLQVSHTADDEQLRIMFGSLLDAFYHLFLAVSGGMNWSQVAYPLFQVHWSNGVVFIFYIFFTVFALTNIITGVFVDTAIQGAANDSDEIIRGHIAERDSQLNLLREIFERLADEDGDITKEDFEDQLRVEQVRAYLAGLGLRVDEARGVFNLLDMEKCGSVSIDELIMGCMRLKGSARAVDLASLMHENNRLYAMLRKFFSFAETEFQFIREGMGKQYEPRLRARKESFARQDNNPVFEL